MTNLEKIQKRQTAKQVAALKSMVKGMGCRYCEIQGYCKKHFDELYTEEAGEWRTCTSVWEQWLESED